MAVPQTKLREIVFLLLYSHGFTPNDEEGIVCKIMTELKVTKKVVYEALAQMQKILEHLGDIDARIEGATDEYAFDRITRVELNALRLGLFELQYGQLLSKNIAISEAIRITRKFGSPEGANFVNALLEVLCKEEKV